MDDGDEVLAALIDRCRRDHLAWVNGDASGYDLSDGGVVLGAFGGAAAGAALAAGQRAAASQFESGSGTIEVLDGGRGGDVAWLVMIERATVRFRQHGDRSLGSCASPRCFAVATSSGVGYIVTLTRSSSVTASTTCWPSSADDSRSRVGKRRSGPSRRRRPGVPGRSATRFPDVVLGPWISRAAELLGPPRRQRAAPGCLTGSHRQESCCVDGRAGAWNDQTSWKPLSRRGSPQRRAAARRSGACVATPGPPTRADGQGRPADVARSGGGVVVNDELAADGAAGGGDAAPVRDRFTRCGSG